jgi:hypothetical protein
VSLDESCDVWQGYIDDDSQNDLFSALQAPLGVSAVRLVPKPNGFRPIVNLGRRSVRTALSATHSGMMLTCDRRFSSQLASRFRGWGRRRR